MVFESHFLLLNYGRRGGSHKTKYRINKTGETEEVAKDNFGINEKVFMPNSIASHYKSVVYYVH